MTVRPRAIPTARAASLALAALLAPSSGLVGTAAATPACPDSSRPFDFVVGGWVGQQFVREADGSTRFVGTTVWTAAPILAGCGFAERVIVHGAEGEHVFTARLLRTYDAEEGRWELTEVDDRGVHLHFQGIRTVDGAWAFEIPRVGDGRPYVLRLTWRTVGDDHVRETFERSYDEGSTFELVSTIDFHRSPGLDDLSRGSPVD